VFKIIVNYAIRNVFRTRLRSFFTIFSVSLVIILYTVLTSIGDSFSKQISLVLDQENIDIVIQAKYATSPVSSIIDTSIVKEIIQLDAITDHNALLIGRKRIKNRASVFILGVSSFNTIAHRLGFSIVNGKALADSSNGIVIGKKMAEIFGLSVGDSLKLSNTKAYHIVGIYSSWLSFLNSGIVMNLGSAQSMLSKPEKISLLLLTLDDISKTESVVDEINKKFPQMRAIESQQLPNYFGVFKSLLYFTKIVSLVTLFIAVAILLNTFLMAINERTKEIGILSAIGWSRQMIVSVFFVEALFLSLGGGLIGYLSSFPVMMVLQNVFSSIYMYLPDAPGLHILLNVVIMCFIISLFSLIFPILYATKIHIAKAIRHE